jgi:tRNA G18 (ribose-2'-O)-methylase SpoU
VVEAIAQRVPVYLCDAGAFLPITGFNIHRGCLAIARRPVAASVDRIAAGARRLVVLERVANADNVGGVFRNAAAFGVDGVVLSAACCDPLYRKAIRTSMAATLTVPYAQDDQWPSALARIRAERLTIVALTPSADAVDLAAFASRARASRLALVLGAEGGGLTPAVEAAADVRVRIPIRPEVDSLNVAVAAGIALYAFADG